MDNPFARTEQNDSWLGWVGFLKKSCENQDESNWSNLIGLSSEFDKNQPELAHEYPNNNLLEISFIKIFLLYLLIFINTLLNILRQ